MSTPVPRDTLDRFIDAWPYEGVRIPLAHQHVGMMSCER